MRIYVRHIGGNVDIPEENLDRGLFDAGTKGRFRREPLEAFACGGCGRIYVAAPYAHALLVDPQDPAREIPFNVPTGTRCPNCGTVLQGEGMNWRETTLEELVSAGWRWLLLERP